MAYSPNIPNQNNAVRGASGDLIKMRTNFQLLDPVVTSGLSGLVGVNLTAPTPASGNVLTLSGTTWIAKTPALGGLSDVSTAGATSGQALTYNGASWAPSTPVQTLSGLTDTTITAPASGSVLTYDGSAWIDGAAPVQSLSGLSDTSLPAPVSGQALIYNGSTWIASGSVPRAYASCYKTADQDITADGGFYVISGFTEVENINGGFTLTSSGFKVTDNTISRVNVQAGADFNTAANQRAGMKITLNGASLETTGYGIESHSEALAGSAGLPSIEITAMNVPVTSGDVIGFSAAINGGATHLVLSGTGTNIAIADAAQAPGGTAAVVPNPRVTLSLASGATFATTQNSDHLLSGLQVREQVGTVAVNAAGGIIEVPSGITHVKLHAQVRWATNASADRRMWFLFDADARPLGNTDPKVAVFSIVQAVNGTNTVQQLHSDWLPVTAGAQIKLYVRQGGSASLNVESGYAVGGTGAVHQTYWSAQFA